MALKDSSRSPRKACVIGLDGVPHSMLGRFLQAGVMPRLAEIARDATLTPMVASLPEISSVSWTTFMTGRNPGEHGIFGFTDLVPGTYRTRFPSFLDVKAETIWDLLGKREMRSVVLNQPATYPARPIPGALVSGFVAVRLEKSVYPAHHLQAALDMGYQVDLDARQVRDDPPALFRELARLLELRRRMLDELWEKERWNLMEVVITGTDRLHHFLWDACEDEGHPHHRDFLDYYRAIDAFIGEVFERFSETGEERNFFVLSDHGFCGARKQAFLNRALAEAGYLTLEDPAADSLEGVSERTRAFVLDPARVYLHRRGRYPKGSVGEGEVAALKRELTEFIGALRHEGAPVVRSVFDAAEIYRGPQADLGPDLLVVPHRGYDLKGRIGADSFIGPRQLQGMHTWDDAFFLTRRRDLLESASDDFHLEAASRMVLRSLDVLP
ncbi:MAG: alkaline phosphatase family protein [Candidatus Eisenbacteria bacterium]|nr:alkaline phosphatase family protein [Candidatus Eisenbacteria bacterium]